jgi:hypothetical protein
MVVRAGFIGEGYKTLARKQHVQCRDLKVNDAWTDSGVSLEIQKQPVHKSNQFQK